MYFSLTDTLVPAHKQGSAVACKAQLCVLRPQHALVVPLQAKVLFAFAAEAEGELSTVVGETLWVENEIEGWYTVYRESDGARGLVPAGYVDLEPY